MKDFVIIISMISLIVGCSTKQLDSNTDIAEGFNCSDGLMTPAWYTMGQSQTVPRISGLSESFVILVDTNQRATNFISYPEKFDREMSISLDTSDLNWMMNGWEEMSTKQKLEKIEQERASIKLWLIQRTMLIIKDNSRFG